MYTYTNGDKYLAVALSVAVSSALSIQVTCVAFRLHFVGFIYIYIYIYIYIFLGSRRTIVHDLAHLRTFPLVTNQSNT